MRVDSVTIKGFRCFDEPGEIINLDNSTCFVGPNSSGKTAAMMALARIFGEQSVQRLVIPSDFHLSVGERLNEKDTRKLFIECRLLFPELDAEGAPDASVIPEMFNQMVVDSPGTTPFCRIQLEATWTNDGTPSGDIEQQTDWILTDSDDPEIINENKQKLLPGARSKISVVYVPAARNPEHQIKATTKSSFGRLMQALVWDGADEKLKETLSILQGQLADIAAVKSISTEIQNSWGSLYDGRVAKDVTLEAIEREPTSLIKLLSPTFCPGEDGNTMEVSGLSDGLRSLFSLSLSLGFFRIEEKLLNSAIDLGFKAEVVEKLPMLTLFAIEEPENHLSPHYLGRVVSELLLIAGDKRAQVIMSSHSPSILSRVPPDSVRYFLGHEETSKAVVRKLSLPEEQTDEAFKYVREAVRGFPELYFSRLVVLGEGASEEIVLRRLFEASGCPLDIHFISVVPLGGRHVNHFWRLLHDLNIPFITLLDLDREKDGAGWGRIQYVRNQLIERFGDNKEELKVYLRDGEEIDLGDVVYGTLKDKDDSDLDEMKVWLKCLQKNYNVFFSNPLDLDFSMLESFNEEYKKLAPPSGGPRLPSETSSEYDGAVKNRMIQVIASDPQDPPANIGSTYLAEQQKLFPWYKYLFVDHSKPVAHMRALLSIEDTELVSKAPKVLNEIVLRAQSLTSSEREPE